MNYRNGLSDPFVSGLFHCGKDISFHQSFGCAPLELISLSKPVGKCKESSFASKAHRVALFPIEYREDGMTGYTVQRRCVNCGKWLGDRMFRISHRDPSADKCIETDGKSI